MSSSPLMNTLNAHHDLRQIEGKPIRQMMNSHALLGRKFSENCLRAVTKGFTREDHCLVVGGYLSVGLKIEVNLFASNKRGKIIKCCGQISKPGKRKLRNSCQKGGFSSPRQEHIIIINLTLITHTGRYLSP